MTNDVPKPASAEPTPFKPYEPRTFRFEALLESGDFRIKLYSITRGEGEPDPDAVAAAADFAEEHLPRQADDHGDHHNAGFVIVHAGEQAVWLLLHWWAHADICCQKMFAARFEAGRVEIAFEPVDRPFHACVWEGVAITHEHRAWMATMLTANPDRNAYLATTLPDGSY